jgi:hypothetical protein
MIFTIMLRSFADTRRNADTRAGMSGVSSE